MLLDIFVISLLAITVSSTSYHSSKTQSLTNLISLIQKSVQPLADEVKVPIIVISKLKKPLQRTKKSKYTFFNSNGKKYRHFKTKSKDNNEFNDILFNMMLQNLYTGIPYSAKRRSSWESKSLERKKKEMFRLINEQLNKKLLELSSKSAYL